MVGRPVKSAFERQRGFDPGDGRLKSGLHAPNGLTASISRSVHDEIVGLAGLVGAGRRRWRAQSSASIRASGEIRVFGAPIRTHPTSPCASGIALIPEKRKRRARAHPFGQDNLLMSALWRLFPRGWSTPRAARGNRARHGRPAAHRDAFGGAAGARAFRRQSAEGRHRQMASPMPPSSSSTSRHAESTSAPRRRYSASSRT